MHRRIVLIVAAAALALAGCTEGEEGNAQSEERDRQQSNYEILVENQPAEQMPYSPTRETINFWMETWGEPGKLSYVYLQGANGELLGYYVLEGLPVSYCASQSPTYGIESDRNGKVTYPRPAMDGVYYSGGQCDSYYGKDASTGTYLEYTAGLGINVLLYEEPLPRQDVQPLGPTTTEDVEE